MSRRKCRILAFQTIFAWEANGRNLPETITDFSWISDEERAKLTQSDLDWVSLIVYGTIENIEKIDETINSLLVKWEMSRLKRVDLAILRLSVYSLLYQSDIPHGVVLQEAVNIAIEFGGEDSFKFINGILDNVKKECEKL